MADPVSVYLGSTVLEKAAEQIGRKVVGRWSDYRARRFIDEFVRAVASEVSGGIEGAGVNEHLESIVDDEVKSAVLFDAFRHVFFSASRDIGPRVIALHAAEVVLGLVEDASVSDMIMSAAGVLLDIEFGEFVSYAAAHGVEETSFADSLDSVAVIVTDPVDFDSNSRGHRQATGLIHLRYELGSWALKLERVGLLTQEVSEEEFNYREDDERHIDEPGTIRRVYRNRLFREWSGWDKVTGFSNGSQAMDDRGLYKTILGLEEPWYVEGVEVGAGEIRVRLERRAEATLECPECSRVVRGYDRSPERRWRHLDTCQYRTVLTARIPRVECPEHGVRQIRVPWAEDRSRFTALFEAWAIRLLQETTTQGLARLMGLSWDEAEGILARAVRRGLERRGDEPARVLGIDETSYQKRHEYVTVVSDLERGRVLWVGDARKKETLAAYYAELEPDHLASIEEVVMDMWEPYIRATLAAVPDAASKIVIDRYHVAHLLVDGVDRVRRDEHAQLRSRGDERLKGTRYIWITGPAKRQGADELRIAELSRSGLRVGRAWALKEAASDLWEYRSRAWALKYFKRWYYWATHSRLTPMIRAAKTMKRYLPWILNYLRHRNTNALAEAINSKIQQVKYRARGYRNRANFRRAILFHCGALDMNPL